MILKTIFRAIFTTILVNTIQTKERKRLTIFDCMIADMLCYKKRNPIVRKLFTKGKKLNNFLFLSQNLILLYPKNYYTKFYSLLYHQKIPNKKEL